MKSWTCTTKKRVSNLLLSGPHCDCWCWQPILLNSNNDHSFTPTAFVDILPSWKMREIRPKINHYTCNQVWVLSYQIVLCLHLISSWLLEHIFLDSQHVNLSKNWIQYNTEYNHWILHASSTMKSTQHYI